jgi:hypothetical protein
VKPEKYLPSPPSYTFNFLLNLKKGCKHFRKLMPSSTYSQSDWKCFENHQNKMADITKEEEEKIAKTSVKGNCLIKAKELQFLTIRNQYLTNSKLYKMGTIESAKCQRCERNKLGYHVDDLPHHFYHCPDSRIIWETLTEIFNENLTYLYIDENIATLNFIDYNEHDYRRLIVNFTRLEISNSRKCDYSLSPELYTRKLKDMCEIFASFHGQRDSFMRIFTYLTFCEIEAREMRHGPSIDPSNSIPHLNHDPAITFPFFRH